MGGRCTKAGVRNARNSRARLTMIGAFLKTTAIQAGAFLPEHNKLLPTHLPPRPLLEVRDGDILITSAGPRARCGIACLVRNTPRHLMISGKMYRFRVPKQHIDARFVEAYLQTTSARDSIERIKTGINDSGLNLTHQRFRQLTLPIAPLNEQRRIVVAIEEQFSRLDAAEVWLRHAKLRLNQMRGVVYSRGIAGDWPVTSLKSLLREPLRNGHSAKASRDGKGIRTLTLTAVTQDDFSEAHTKLTTANPTRVQDLWLEPRDILIERSNTPELVGTAALFRGPRKWAIFPDLLIRVRVSEEVLPEFLGLVLKAEPARRYFRRAAQGIAGSMPKIDQGTVERLLVPVPPLDEQCSLVAEVERQLSLVGAMSAEIAVALRRGTALRRSILENAFTGKLVPQDLADEPAPELLKRISAEHTSTPQTHRRRHRVPA